jgi:hypothetical protein
VNADALRDFWGVDPLAQPLGSLQLLVEDEIPGSGFEGHGHPATADKLPA